MFPGRYFPTRFFNDRYWAKVGAVEIGPDRPGFQYTLQGHRPHTTLPRNVAQYQARPQ